MSIPKQFRALLVSKSEVEQKSNRASVAAAVGEFRFVDLDQGEVVIRTRHSALNYKDALASIGNRGVARKLPLIPGIDAVGEVVQSSAETIKVGDEVLVAAAEFGTAHHGGLSQYVRVPAEWAYPIPMGLSPIDAVTWGTAGFTAAQSVQQILLHGIDPQDGEILVTGATGGVGIFAVKLLAKLGYQVVAATGKMQRREWLMQQGAAEVIDRSEVVDDSDTPLLKSRWAAAVDCVGGATLETVLRSAKQHSCITACGLVGGHELKTTVYPFILRGVTLCGIDSANISRRTRADLWGKIARDWQMDLSDLITEIELGDVHDAFAKMLDGNLFGRTVVNF